VAPTQRRSAPVGQASEKHKLTVDRSRNDQPLRRMTEPIENASSGLSIATARKVPNPVKPSQAP